MKSIVKYLLSAVLLLLLTVNAKSQSVHVTDLVKLAKASHLQATQYISTSLHFSLIASENANGQPVSRYAKSDGKTIEAIIKTQSPAADKSLHAIIDYSLRPRTLAANLVKELEKAKFKAVRKIHDKYKDDKLYENAQYTVSVYTFADKKFPAAIELRVK